MTIFEPTSGKNAVSLLDVSSSEEGSYLRLVDFCITQLQAESNKEEEEDLRLEP